MPLFNLIKAVWFIFQFRKTQTQFNEQFIDSYLQPFYKQYNKQLKDSTLYKIKNIYCIGMPVTVAVYAKLYGRNISQKEREYATLMGICTPLVDDFTDEKTISREAINQLIFSPDDYKPVTLEEDIVKSIGCHLLKNIKNIDGFSYFLKRTMQAQYWSEKQMHPNVSSEELLKIMLEKGGSSQILPHYIIDEAPTQQTLDTIYLIGGLIQMYGDIFEVYKDFKEGIATIANTCDNYKTLEDYYTNECKRFVKMARALPYQKHNKELLTTFFVIIFASGIVPLRMFHKLQIQLGGGILPFEQLERKQVICDMDKPLNLLKATWFAYKLLLK